MAIQSDPVSNQNPQDAPAPARAPHRVFTTLYWLTCPMQIDHLSRCESAGWIQRLEDTVQKNINARERMNDLHGEYAFRRRRAVGAGRLAELRRNRPHLANSLEQTGIAGVKDTAHIKCLHAHAAYHLVQGDHPLFVSFPELLKDPAGCRDCERLHDGV